MSKRPRRQSMSLEPCPWLTEDVTVVMSLTKDVIGVRSQTASSQCFSMRLMQSPDVLTMTWYFFWEALFLSKAGSFVDSPYKPVYHPLEGKNIFFGNILGQFEPRHIYPCSGWISSHVLGVIYWIRTTDLPLTQPGLFWWEEIINLTSLSRAPQLGNQCSVAFALKRHLTSISFLFFHLRFSLLALIYLTAKDSYKQCAIKIPESNLFSLNKPVSTNFWLPLASYQLLLFLISVKWPLWRI